MSDALILGVIALALAWPVPLVLRRLPWTARYPAAALVLWQAIALAGGMCMIASLLSYAVEPTGQPLVPALVAIADGQFFTNDGDLNLGTGHVLALCAALLLLAHLLITLAVTWRRAVRRRRAHRDLLALLSEPTERKDTLVVNHPIPLAYALPGYHSVTVLSDGLIAALKPAELEAVVAHERAHLAQRHHLLLLAFAAWRSSLPWLPTSQLALGAVSDLVEMLADDDALKHTDRKTLVSAIAVVGCAGRPDEEDSAPAIDNVDSFPAIGDAAPRRISRLLNPPTATHRWAPPLAIAIAVVLALGPIALLF